MLNQEYFPILLQSLKDDQGDWGRTQYLIKRIENNQEIFKSDLKYIQRLGQLQESKKSSKESSLEQIEHEIQRDLIKCSFCDLDIKLEERSLRKKNSWFHENCFQRITFEKPSQIIISAHPKQKEEFVDKTKQISIRPNYSALAFSSGLLASLTTSTYFLLEEISALIVGITGTGLLLAVHKSTIISKKKKKSFRTNKEEVIKTGIQGFDLLANGFKKNSSILVSGPPGSGKTTFGLQYLYSGAKDFDEPGVYVTLSQSIDEIKSDSKSFGWDFDNLINQDKILMIDARPFKIQDELIGKDDSLYRGEQLPFEHLTKLLLSSIKRLEAKRVVIDSISILEMQYQDKFYVRQGLQGMVQALENHGATTLLLSESNENKEIPLEWFVTSGIIHLRHSRIADTMERTIQVTKMRGIHHSEQIHPIILNGDGMHVQHPRLMP